MADPLILFENIFDVVANPSYTLTSSGDAASYPKENVYDWRSATPYRWQADVVTSPVWLEVDTGVTTTSVQTLAIGGHNFAGLGATSRLKILADDFTPPTTVWLNVLINELADPYMSDFMAAGDDQRYWRFELSRSAGNFTVAPAIGILTVGRKMELEGAQANLDPYNSEAVTDWTHNENGQLLGANLRYRRKRYVLDYTEAGMAKTDFFQPATGLGMDDDFEPHLRDKPFWFGWNLTEEANYCDLVRAVGPVMQPFVGSLTRRALIMQLEALRVST